MKKLNHEDLKNILNILKDPDEKIYKLVEEQILSNGEVLFEDLKKEFWVSENFLIKKRLIAIIDKIYYKNAEESFRKIPLNEAGDVDLEEASFILANYGYPEMDVKKYKEKLDKIANTIKERIVDFEEPEQIIREINNYLFGEAGFKGNREDYFNPDNSYINMVLERKKGIPISLSVFYLLITQRLGLPVFGVGMPGHFIIKYKKDDFELFIDPFHRGKILSKQECINFLIFSGYGFSERYLDISLNKEILKRMIRNLLLIYEEKGDTRKYNKLKDILSIVDINY